MKTHSIFSSRISGFVLMSLLLILGCQNDDSDLQKVKVSSDPNVFIDTFSGGLNYAAFSNTDIFAFQVDTEVTYNNSSASMRIDVPNANDPAGSYAGGSFFTSVGRDLSGYNVLTFWAKSTKAATLGVVGFGIDLGANTNPVSLNNLRISTAWKKYYIPIPDASKLKSEKGLFYFSAGPENGDGYTFWVDEVKFEKLGTIAHGEGSILNGDNKTQISFVGVSTTIDGLKATFNLPNGINQDVTISPNYLEFTSSNTAVATVNALGVVNTLGSGSAVITAKLAGQPALGSLTINSSGTFTNAPIPSENAADVISVFSNNYTNVPVEYYNGYWGGSSTISNDFNVNGDNVLNYSNLNYVGIQFSQPTVNASLMSHLHIDLYMPNAIPSGANFKIEVNDWGSDNSFGGGNDDNGNRTFTTPTLVSQNWISLDIPLSSLTGLSAKGNIAQIVFSSSNISNFYADNIYFYNDGSIIPAVPTLAAPTPTELAANVISIFSDAYTNVAGSNLNPNWGQATVTTQVPIAGNNTLKYAGLNYQGLQFGTSQNVTSKNFLHLDYYTANSTSLKVYLISTGPIEKPVILTVPTSGTNGWKSIDIPLTSFSPVNLADVIQMKFDGNGEIYLDNIYFKN